MSSPAPKPAPKPAPSPATKPTPAQGQTLAPGLYLLPSPLGNLADLSQRFVQIASAASVIAAEDTRRTLKLLNHLGLKKKLYSYREENHRTILPSLLRHLAQGEIVAYLSDAGAPCVADPGAGLVSEARNSGFAVFPIPGPSAVITALMASGFEASSFTFLGFLSPKSESRQKYLESIKDRPEPIIIFIPPHKLLATLEDLLKVLGPRPALMAREMTKLHEEYLALNLDQLLSEVTKKPRRGELTLVIGPNQAKSPISLEPPSPELIEQIKNDSRPTKEVAAHYAQTQGLSKKALYHLILEIRKKQTLDHE
ncbi:MAG: 16S rRNA (cytidine(1402)-2'-O)-methyltransferase [Deltaproteobacteria bacterium]|jgi:16S rRNA (cytidine1402-2'-O)-methyltransferase|nr:16S rRNA (cytidine(1402)-2'-O)-methyltransferase [Deltaproteobacteria bacterium]